VYLGILKDETQVAVKLLSTSSKQGYKEFRAEVRYVASQYSLQLLEISILNWYDYTRHGS
jgi:hypothetical protein